MAVQVARVIRGTKDDLIEFITTRMDEEAEVAMAKTGTAKSRAENAGAARALEWVVETLRDWEPTTGASSVETSNGLEAVPK